ncbi:aminoacyl-tRNA hydrolase [Limnohabitans sp. T6-5]|uniref:alternative ribosome rescue aminoacyl-tRNA hydrolase ArfB n=1 Tax=Limnohabitans sp. T6-5 TaxID=1100724 RepID=UPI000D3B0502|nr:alternative ribosome rescue aminoacyl-tRNA hydrolase ArfB [Limnohabitans sp. T6-5]PUE10795.1 aminoacyl-tRNA hydrolase [Limnohabitans sp. T6-5]
METLHIPDTEVELTAVRAQGPGGQNVNKVSTAIQLRFDVAGSSLPEDVKQRWLQSGDSRLTQEGVLILKAQRYRTQEANRQDAWTRLYELLERFVKPPKRRKATKPTYGSVQRRLEGKAIHAKLKATRRQTDE